MYRYIVEKKLPGNYSVDDVVELNELLTNSENVHRLLGRLLNVENEKDWRSRYGVLYKRIDDCVAKWLVQTNRKINLQTAQKENIGVTECGLPDFNGVTNIKIIVAPFLRSNPNKKNRTIIPSTEERVSWLSTKLSYGGRCQVLSCEEKHQIISHMAHKDTSKGCATLIGYEYHIKVKVLDKPAFEQMVSAGVGPCKSYGFGLVENA